MTAWSAGSRDLAGGGGTTMGSADVNPSATAPRVNLAASLQDLLRDVRLIRGNLTAQIDRLDRLESELVLLAACRGKEPLHIDWVTNNPGPVIHHLTIKRHRDDSIDVEIDANSSASFHLGPRLAGVFLFLAQGDKAKSSDDALVPWRSRNEVIKFLEDRMQRVVRPRYVSTLLHSLRQALKKAGYAPELIQSDGEKGLRLALKRQPALAKQPEVRRAAD